MASFGEKLKDAREAAGLTQSQLAEQSGIALGTIREYEQNKREPLISKAGKLARALNQPLETFLPDGSTPPDDKPAGPSKRTTTPSQAEDKADKPSGKKGKRRRP